MKSLCKDLIKWWSNLVKVFGLRTIVLIIVVYATEGFNSFSSLGVNYYLKDTLGLQPSVSQVIKSTSHIPWDLKPVFGFISDSLPILGRHRKPYLILVGILGFASWIELSRVSVNHTIVIVTTFFFITNLSTAFSDVVVDAIVVEEARKEPVTGTGDLQSLSWMSSSLMGLIGAIFGGMAVAKLHSSGVFMISSFGPLILVPVAVLIKEQHRGRCCADDCCVGQLRILCRSVLTPKVWKPALWIFMSVAIVPGYGSLFFYFQTNPVEGTPFTKCANITSNSSFIRNMTKSSLISNITDQFPICETLFHNNGGLAFEENFLSILMVVGYACLFIGTLLYNWKLKHMRIRKILLLSQLVLTFLSFGDVILATHLNRRVGIPDKVFVVGTEVAGDVIGRLQTMPILVLCAKICPAGVEATLFSLLMSLSNASYDISAYLGAFCMELLGISRTDFGQLWLLTIISSSMSIVPIFFLFLIPNDDILNARPPLIEEYSDTTSIDFRRLDPEPESS